MDKAAELVGTVKQFLKVIEGRTAELVNEQKADLILNREQLAQLRVSMGQIASAAQGVQKELAHFLEEEVRGLILAHVEDAASAAGRAQAQQFGREVAAEARKALEDGAVPIFYAYSLGKAQEAMAILGAGGVPLCAHGAIASMAAVYTDAGVTLPPFESYDVKTFDGTRALLWPPSGKALPVAVRGRAVRTAALTGWVVAKGANFARGTDVGFPLSDHADFPSLLRYVELAQPRKVLLNHGWRDFTHRLRKLGVDAEYLEANVQLALF